MTRLIASDLLWHEGEMREGLAIEVAGGALRRIRPLNPGETPDLRAGLIGPALTDIQVNGSGGVMLNSYPTAEAIAHIVATQRDRGTGWVMPTLITCEPDRMKKAADAARDAWGLPGFLGLHIEGPHINPLRKGTHNPAFIRPIDEPTIEILKELSRTGIPVMLTLAPEVVPPHIIRQIADMGVIVSAGHSEATTSETRSGIAAGISCFTHLFNAMPPMQSREPGIVGVAINSDSFAGIIVDGHHVVWEMVGLACRARPVEERMFMVSDAMATIGGPDHFDLYGETITMRAGALVNKNGSLAGAHIDLATCLFNAVHHVGLPIAEAYRMAAMIPLDAMHLQRPELIIGMPVTEMLVLDGQWSKVGF